MQVTLIRHLPTEWNVKTWLQGRQDIDILPITDTDRDEINKNLQYLRKLSPIDVVLVSTLKRTHQTAQLYRMEAKIEAFLDELDFGSFEGRPKEELWQEFGQNWLENPRELRLGESLLDLEQRIVNFLRKYKEYNQILVFGHGSWIRAFISYIQYGHINHMNKITVENNECITLTFDIDTVNSL